MQLFFLLVLFLFPIAPSTQSPVCDDSNGYATREQCVQQCEAPGVCVTREDECAYCVEQTFATVSSPALTRGLERLANPIRNAARGIARLIQNLNPVAPAVKAPAQETAPKAMLFPGRMAIFDVMDHIKKQEEKTATPEDERAAQEKIKKYIKDAQSIEDLLYVRDAVLAYCNDTIWDKTNRREEVDALCAKLKQQLKEKGNTLKDEMLARIHTLGIKELMFFRTLLMVGDPDLFSEENLKKAYAAIMGRGDAWKEAFLERLRQKQPLTQQDIDQFRALLLAGEGVYFSKDNVAYVLGELAALQQTLIAPVETPTSPDKAIPGTPSAADTSEADTAAPSKPTDTSAPPSAPAPATSPTSPMTDTPTDGDTVTPPPTEPLPQPPEPVIPPPPTDGGTVTPVEPLEPPLLPPPGTPGTATPVQPIPPPPIIPPDVPPPPPPEPGTTVTPAGP